MIKKSKTADEARMGLMSRFGLDVEQANAILEMQLRRLTGLEQDKIKAEYDDLKQKIKEYEELLADRQKVLDVVKVELNEDKEKYGDERRTQILPEADEMTIEDLTPNVPMAVFITRQGYLKRISLDVFERQNRATRGKAIAACFAFNASTSIPSNCFSSSACLRLTISFPLETISSSFATVSSYCL